MRLKMDFKKIIASLVAIMIFIVFLLSQNIAYATILPAGQEVYMGITELMTNDNPNIGYAINTPGSGNGAKIWNIVKYASATSDGFTDANIYCVKAGIGFTQTDNGTIKRAPYNVNYDMKTERDSIKAQNDILKSLVEANINEADGSTYNRYDALLAVLDMLYLPGESTADEKKALLDEVLNYAKQPDSGYTDYVELMENYPLTDDDINAIQQAVIWYFTNYYKVDTNAEKYTETTEHDTKYDKREDKGWLNYTLDGTTYKPYSNYKPNGLQEQYDAGQARTYQAEVLYNYIIRQAKANANKYTNITTTTSGAPARVDTTTLQSETSGSNYIIGPIHITQLNSTPYTIDFKVKNNGTEVTNYQLLDSSKKPVSSETTVKNLVGNDFYISVPSTQVSKLTVSININYGDRTMKLWASTTNNQEQPLAEVNKTNKSIPTELTLIKEESFDLKLIKRITEVNNKAVPERIQSIDASKLNTLDADGKLVTTADYKLNKEPVSVKKGDIVTYTFRIYNEGTIDGYAQEITEDIPEGLQFIWSEKEGEDLKNDTTLTAEEKEAIEFNQKYLWGKFVYDETKQKIIQISSDYLSKENETTVGENLIKAFGENDGTKTEKDLSYKELSVKLKVVAENKTGTPIRNEAEISEDCDENGDPIDDRDSDTEDWKPHPDHEDDEDHDYIILQSFDLALRKFIIAISNDTKIEDKEYLKDKDGSYKREPVVDTSKLNTVDSNGNLITTAIYNHTKEPVLVKQKDIVVYMLRVYNEGEQDGYAAEIKDHLPPYLEYVDDEFNKQYGWEVSSDGRTVTTKYLENSLINKPTTDENGKIILNYKEVPIMCRVSENAKTSENITNIADITKYLDENKQPVEDRDSEENNVKLPEDKDLPGYKENEKDSYVPGQQDDDDFEKVIIKVFDLALRKWVTQAIVIEDGKQTITQTGHDAWDDPEAVVKVELHRKKINQVTVKFRYSIRVINQGEIAGYAKEVTDYIPEGLKFVAEDNPGWTDEGNNVISTRLLENTLLQPGESAEVEVLLTWVNSQNNMGVMNNIAEISEDYNEYDVPDIDSTPDNQKPGEDDIDDAPVMLSISTGQARIYFGLGFVVLITIAGGIILIKRYVL